MERACILKQVPPRKQGPRSDPTKAHKLHTITNKKIPPNCPKSQISRKQVVFLVYYIPKSTKHKKRVG